MPRLLSLLVLCPLLMLVAPAHADDDDDDHNRDVTPVELFLTADIGYRLLQINEFEIDGEGDIEPRLIPATSHGVAPGVQLGVRAEKVFYEFTTDRAIMLDATLSTAIAGTFSFTSGRDSALVARGPTLG